MVGIDLISSASSRNLLDEVSVADYLKVRFSMIGIFRMRDVKQDAYGNEREDGFSECHV